MPLLSPETGDVWLRTGPIKVTLDGGSTGALFTRPYAIKPDFHGVQVTSTEVLKEISELANQNNWRMSVHCNGDKAFDILLDTWEAVNKKKSIVGKRWTVEHGKNIRPEQIRRVKALGLLVTIQAAPYVKGETYMTNFGRETAEQSSPTRDYLKSGIVLRRIGLADQSAQSFSAHVLRSREKDQGGKSPGPEPGADSGGGARHAHQIRRLRNVRGELERNPRAGKTCRSGRALARPSRNRHRTDQRHQSFDDPGGRRSRLPERSRLGHETEHRSCRADRQCFAFTASWRTVNTIDQRHLGSSDDAVHRFIHANNASRFGYEPSCDLLTSRRREWSTGSV